MLEYYQINTLSQAYTENSCEDLVEDEMLHEIQNPNFATNCEGQNRPTSAVAQGVEGDQQSEGVVTYETTASPSKSPPHSKSLPSINTSSSLPAYIDLGKAWVASHPKPRGRHASKKPPAWLHRKWVFLKPEEKLQAVFRHAHLSEALAFSLNFNAKRLARLEKVGDPARVLSQEVNRLAKKTFGFLLPMAFGFEFAPETDRLHVHGIVVLPDFHKQTVAVLRQVLKQAGGVIHGVGAGRQCDDDILYKPQGWLDYVLKDSDRTADLLGTDKITFISREMVRSSKAAHDAEHTRLKNKARRLKGKADRSVNID